MAEGRPGRPWSESKTLAAANIAVSSLALVALAVVLAVAITAGWFSKSEQDKLWLKIETQQLQINRLERELEYLKGAQEDGKPPMREGDH